MPYDPGPNALEGAFRVADLMRRAGGARANATAARGAGWADLVQGVGTTVGDLLEQRTAAKQAAKLKAEDREIVEAITGGDAPEMVARKYGVERVSKVVAAVRAMQPPEKDGFTLGEGQKRYDASGKEIASGPAKPVTPTKPNIIPIPGGGGLYDADLRIIIPGTAAQPKSEKGPNSQSESFLLDGKAVKGDYIPGANGKTGRYFYNGQDVTDRARVIPPASIQYPKPDAPPIEGNFDLTGEEFLKTLPKEVQATVRKIANYDEDIRTAVAARGGSRERMQAWVNQYRPDYDASAFSTIAPTRKAFTIGVQGRQINALNTAIGHIDQMTNLADQLDNGGFVPANKAFNNLRTLFGSDKVTNFDTLKDALGGEIAGVLAQNGATVSAIQDAKSHISNASSAKQLAGYVKTQIPILGSKLASLTDAYRKGMGTHDPSYSALSEASKAILKKHGFDPEHPEIGEQKKSKRYTIVGVQ